MKGPLKEMMERYRQPGAVAWIGVRAARRKDMLLLDRVEVTEAGLVGDHGRPGKRAVTLFQAEHLVAVGAYLGGPPIMPELLRRNLVVSGLNLSALRGRDLRLGSAVLRITGPCAPCSRMEEALGKGGYAALRGHGGWCAEVRTPGQIALGDRVSPRDEGPHG